ncbi:MAG: 1-acyl-sn-glycerol-3-phosphate acyltransferase [Anaerolineaceae bacterium]|nr:1-acyl-sn-glycerol-3-phosphate acyltransferase [Anaerolineaceae bacterium]
MRLHKNLLYKFTRGIVRVYSKLMFQIDIESHEELPDGAKIFVANHPSFTDPFLLHLHSPMSVLITGKAFAIPLIGGLLRHIGQISAAKGSGSLDNAVKLLANGRSVGIFPEGANSPQSSRFADPRSGAARLALMSGAPVIPIGIHLRRDRFFRSLAVMTRKRDIGWFYLWGPYIITIGKPMHFNGDTEDRELVGEISQVIMQSIKILASESEARLTSKLNPVNSKA